MSAVIETRPFRLLIKDSAGQTVLASIVSDIPLVNPDCYYCEPDLMGGFWSLPPLICDCYAPLFFEIGEPEEFDFLDLLVAEPMQIYRDTKLYFAKDVVKASASGKGQLFTLSTTRDDTTVDVLVEPDPSGVEAMRIKATVNNARAQNVSFAFASNKNESFYGFGGRRGTLDQKGKEIFSWTMDAMAQNAIVDQYSLSRAYGPQALFYSSGKYAFLLENSELARFYMGNDRDNAWKVNVSSGKAAFVVSAGDYRQNIENITAINGRHRAVPDWAKGLIFAQRSPITFIGEAEPGAYFRDAMTYLRKLTELNIETSGYLIEAWASSANITRDELDLLLAELDRLDIRPLTYMRMMLTDDSLNTEDPEIYNQAYTNGYMPTREDGSPYAYPVLMAPTSVVDYTNPQALDWWQQRVNRMLDLGSEGFMFDFGEQVRPDMRFYNGETGRSMHNRLPVLGNKETARIVDAYEQAHPGRDIFFFTRANYSGRPGSPAYETAQFLGDNTQSWDADTGLKSVLPDILNRGLGGAYNTSTDIGGYWDLYGVCDKELFIRWTQLATFISVFRLHNSPFTALKTPWSYDDQTVQVFKSVLALRKKALPYMNTLWQTAAAAGLPLWRPMWLEFPDDVRFRNEMGQFMLGDKVLVAPVLDKGKRVKSVILPQGCWQYMRTNYVYQGGQTVTVDAPLDVLPYFFKCGETPF
ncbi:MAG: TIM-barrel domain-containing protein [Thermodesulfobacteriota bacterium]